MRFISCRTTSGANHSNYACASLLASRHNYCDLERASATFAWVEEPCECPGWKVRQRETACASLLASRHNCCDLERASATFAWVEEPCECPGWKVRQRETACASLLASRHNYCDLQKGKQWHDSIGNPRICYILCRQFWSAAGTKAADRA